MLAQTQRREGQGAAPAGDTDDGCCSGWAHRGRGGLTKETFLPLSPAPSSIRRKHRRQGAEIYSYRESRTKPQTRELGTADAVGSRPGSRGRPQHREEPRSNTTNLTPSPSLGKPSPWSSARLGELGAPICTPGKTRDVPSLQEGRHSTQFPHSHLPDMVSLEPGHRHCPTGLARAPSPWISLL